MVQFKISQINVGHRKAAANILLVRLTELDIYMAQEPYTNTDISTIPGIPPSCGMIRHILNSKIAILVPATGLSYVVNHVSRDVITITINTGNVRTLISVHASPLEDFEHILSML